MSRVVVLDAGRSAIGKFMGSLSKLGAADLGTECVTSLIDRVGIKAEQVDEVILGVGRQAGSGPNPARQVLIRSGVSQSATAVTLNMACGSGMLSIIQGAQSIQRGDSDIVVAGGMESMSRLPYYLEDARTGYRLGHGQLVDGMYRDGFHCPLADQLMGRTAETLAQEYNISRQEQAEQAVLSQSRCQNAQEQGWFKNEILPIRLKSRKGETVFEVDEHPRHGANIESMAKLKPVFLDDGSVHPGNASGITDGAAALILASEDKAKELGIEPLAYVGMSAQAGVDPARMGIGPVPAIHKLFKKNSRSMSDYDLVELNEAFAAQLIACQKDLEIDSERLNVNGGAIALGHPIGATGARICVTGLHELIRRKGSRLLTSLCISGGMGLALEFSRD